MLHRRLVPLVAAAMLMALPSLPSASAADTVNSPNMTHVANLAYGNGNNGSDLELTTLSVDFGDGRGSVARDFAVTGTEGNGMRLIDVTDPTHPVIAQTYSCGAVQGDIQIFTRGGRTYIGYGIDDAGANLATQCYQDGLALPAQAGNGTANPYGTFIIDITNPYDSTSAGRVRVVGWARWANGSHNNSIDPSGQWLYSSNQDLTPRITTTGPLYQMETFSLADLTNPVLVNKVPLSTGAGPHDVTFSADGTRAYLAALTHSVIFDTTDMAHPKQLGVVIDPSITIHHQADPVELGGRRYLIVSDEIAGVIIGLQACPGGGLHIYDITGPLELAPVKVGYFAIPRVEPGGAARCSAHVFRVYPERNLMTIAWYGAGVRVLDVSGLAGVSAGVSRVGSVGTGIREVGSFFFTGTGAEIGSETWAAKIHHFEPNGSAYIYGNDIVRGFDVYYFDATKPQAPSVGTWIAGPNAGLAQARAARGNRAGIYEPRCAIPASPEKQSFL